MEPSNTSTLISQVVSSVIGENVANIDPVALKADSAIKQSIAIRTGDQKLLQEARIQQSIADRLGARNALMHKMPPVALELGDKDPVTMKAHSAIKRSIADRTGNLQLLEEAKQEQSAADRLGARSALSQSREDGSQSPIIDEAARADGGRSPQRSPTIKPEPLDRSPVFGSTKAKRGSPIVEKAAANGAYRLSQQKMDSYERERGNNRLDRNRNNSGSRDLNKAARPSGTANAQTTSAPIQDLLKMRRRSLSADDATNGFVQWRQNAALAQQLAQNPDPTALKRDAALKQSLAARVGDQALMKQARIEQSLADKMGGRQALMHIANPAPTSPTATSPPPPQQQQPLVVKHEVRQPPTTLVDNFAGQKVGPTRANIQKQIQKNIFKIAPIEGELAQKLEVVKRRMSQDLNPEESTAAQLAQLALRKTPLVRSRSQDYSGEPLPSISEEVNEPYSFDGLPDEAERSQPAVGTVDAEVHNEAHAGGVFGMVTGLMSSLAGKVLGRDSETTAVPKDAEDP